LSLLMFLLYAPAGALIPFLPLRAKELEFTSMDLAWAAATQALAAFVGPVVGQVADRWCSAERCLAVLGTGAGIVLWLLADVTEPLTFILVCLAFWLMMGPTITLGISLSFTHLRVPERHFGPVRMWGTIGWASVGWIIGYWYDDPAWLEPLIAWLRPGLPRSELADAFRLGGALSVALGVYALTLPHTPPQRHASFLAPLAALQLLRSRAFAVYFWCTLGLCMTLPFSGQVTPLFLEHLGIPQPWVPRTLTIAQSMEIVALALLPVLLNRGVRSTMLVGLGAWLLAMTILMLGQPVWLVISSMALNGLCICGYFVAGQVFVNSRARGDIRASAQALLALVNGTGLLLGNLLVGGVRDYVDGRYAPTYGVAVVLTAALAVVFFVGFAEEENGRAQADAKKLEKGPVPVRVE
jgi:MFS family permease